MKIIFVGTSIHWVVISKNTFEFPFKFRFQLKKTTPEVYGTNEIIKRLRYKRKSMIQRFRDSYVESKVRIRSSGKHLRGEAVWAESIQPVLFKVLYKRSWIPHEKQPKKKWSPSKRGKGKGGGSGLKWTESIKMFFNVSLRELESKSVKESESKIIEWLNQFLQRLIKWFLENLNLDLSSGGSDDNQRWNLIMEMNCICPNSFCF